MTANHIREDEENKSTDAIIIFNRFWDTHPQDIKTGTEPILDFIQGVPSVRVFHE